MKIWLGSMQTQCHFIYGLEHLEILVSVGVLELIL